MRSGKSSPDAPRPEIVSLSREARSLRRFPPREARTRDGSEEPLFVGRTQDTRRWRRVLPHRGEDREHVVGIPNARQHAVLRPEENRAGRVPRLYGAVVVPDLVLARVDDDARVRVSGRERQSDQPAALRGEGVDVQSDLPRDSVGKLHCGLLRWVEG